MATVVQLHSSSILATLHRKSVSKWLTFPVDGIRTCIKNTRVFVIQDTKTLKCSVVGRAEQISKKHSHQVIMLSLQTWVP